MGRINGFFCEGGGKSQRALLVSTYPMGVYIVLTGR